MARRLARTCGPYALVAASPAVRARQTAQLIAGRLDAIEDALLPDMSGVLTSAQFMALRSLAEVRALLEGAPETRRFAEAQLAYWTDIASRIRDEQRALAVSHGGLVDLVACLVAGRTGATLEGRPFGYCEGVALSFRARAPVALEVLRVSE